MTKPRSGMRRDRVAHGRRSLGRHRSRCCLHRPASTVAFWHWDRRSRSTPTVNSNTPYSQTSPNNTNNKKAQLSLGKTRYSIYIFCCDTDFQGYPRSTIFMSFESQYATFY